MDTSALVDDAYALVEAKDLGVTTLLDITFSATKRAPKPATATDTDYQAWYQVSSTLNAIEGKLEGGSCHQAFRGYISSAISSAVDDYGLVASLTRTNSAQIEGSFQNRLLVGMLFSLGVEFDNEQVQSLALQGFSATTKVHPNLRYSVYKATARSGLAGFNEVLQRYRGAIDADEKEKLLLALGSVTEEGLLKKALDLVMTDGVESMDVRSYVARIAGTGLLGRQLAWKFLQENFDAVYEKVNGSLDVSSSRLAKLVSRVCGGFADDAKL